MELLSLLVSCWTDEGKTKLGHSLHIEYRGEYEILTEQFVVIGNEM
jgi:hypothetical protein